MPGKLATILFRGRERVPMTDPVDAHEVGRGAGVHGGLEHLVLYPTWLGLVATGVVPLGLVILGLLAFVRGAGGIVSGSVVAFGLLAGGLAGRDLPRSVVIGPDGIERRCLLRRHHLSYHEVAAIRRAPGSRLAAARTARSGGASGSGSTARITGGLVASGPGRRRWMLTDQPESRAEYDRLAQLLTAHGATTLEADRPPPSATPTSLYRRERSHTVR